MPDLSSFSASSTPWWETRWTLPHGGELFTDFNLPQEVGKFRGYDRHLRPGLQIYTFDARFYSPINAEYTFLDEGPYLWLSTTFTGAGRYRVSDSTEGQIKSGTSCFALLRDPNCIINFGQGKNISGGVTLTTSYIADLLGDDVLEQEAKRLVRGEFNTSMFEFGSNSIVRGIVQKMFAHPYVGAFEELFLEAKAFELIAEYQRVSCEQSKRRYDANSLRYVRAAQDIVMADMGSACSISHISKKIGISQRRLSEACRQIYGVSTLKCIIDWRLEKAKKLLQTGEYSIKQVSHFIGYGHTSNFSIAFSRHFGIPPSEVIKNSGEE